MPRCARRPAGLLPTVVLLWLLVLLGGCSRELAYRQFEGATMGTRYHIRYQPTDASQDDAQLRRDVDARLERLVRSLSTYREDSAITAFNNAAPGEVLPIDEDFERVLALSREVHQASRGAFDPTVGALVNLWGFGWPRPTEPLTRLPDAASIEAARGRFDALVQPGPGRLGKTAPLRLDFSAIAKGYGVDLIAQVLRERGIRHYMVEIGGEVATRGQGPSGGAWRIGIETPEPGTSGQILAKLHLGDAALATSGNYRNFFELEGRRFSHIIDPVSGWPVENPPVSVSVLADSVARADAWATAFMVLEEAAAAELAETHGLAVYWVYEQDGQRRTRQSARMQAFLTPPAP